MIGKKIRRSKKCNNIKTLYESQEKLIKLCDNYSRIVSEAIYKTKEGLKFLTPKQILQRFQ